MTNHISIFLKKNLENILIFFVLIIGFMIRIYLSFTSYNDDITHFIETTNIFLKGMNVYKVQKYYNYSPVFFHILGLIGLISHYTSPLFNLSINIRIFLSFIDVITLFLLMKISEALNLSKLKTASFFFLNPLTVIISAKHGQFDNLAILFIIFCLYLYVKYKKRNALSKVTMWVLLTLSLLIKHIVIFQVLILTFRVFRNKITSLLFFLLAILLLLTTFFPYWSGASEYIIINVFKYGGISGSYGITSFIKGLCGTCVYYKISLIYLYKYIFILLSMLVSLVLICLKKDLIWTLLTWALFFLSFTSGIGSQYVILPIAFASLRPSKMFAFYTLVTTAFLLGYRYEFDVKLFTALSWNVVWFSSLLWFIAELRSEINFLQPSYFFNRKNN